jgi:hypothetical protein
MQMLYDSFIVILPVPAAFLLIWRIQDKAAGLGTQSRKLDLPAAIEVIQCSGLTTKATLISDKPY